MLSVHTSPIAELGAQEAGGLNVYVRDLSQELGRRLLERRGGVDIYTRSQEPTLPRIQHLADNVRVIQIKAGPEAPYNKNKIYDHLDEFTAGVLAYQGDYDIVFGHYWLSGLVGLRLRPHWHAPVVQMFHTLAALKNIVAQSEQEREPSQRQSCEGELMQRVDRVIAATPVDRNQMREHYNAPADKISVIPPGVDLTRFTPMSQAAAKAYLGIPPKHHNLLFVGRIQPLKGIDVLLRALAIVKRQQPALAANICLAIIGGGVKQSDAEAEAPEMARLTALRAELGLSDMVTFLGAKDQDTLVYYYSAAEMVIIPSHYESFGLVAVEAMACGRPVIASDVGGLTFSVEDGFNGYLVPARDHEALAKKIILLLKQPLLKEQLGEQARLWVERFSWSNIADELLVLFEEMVINGG